MYKVDPNIANAETLPAAFYKDRSHFQLYTDMLLSKSWQWVGDKTIFSSGNNVQPFVFHENTICEPLIFIKQDEENYRCLSNVCTHRGNLLISEGVSTEKLICGYHGRKFNLDGIFESMPEFEEVQNFPRECDHLTSVPLKLWQQFLFVNLDPVFDFSSITTALDERVRFLPIESFIKDSGRSKEYIVKSHWALYCDNYLEGFHIPFVHPDLNQAVEYNSYETILYDYCNLQIGYSKNETESFELPEDHPDYGKNVAAYYYWIFPNLMLNFYPWGLSVNIISPIDHETTKVSFISYVYDESKIDSSAGTLLDKVEMEDEFVVEGVQKGIQSRFYSTGRFSPTKEKGVHHFHSLISKTIQTTNKQPAI